MSKARVKVPVGVMNAAVRLKNSAEKLKNASKDNINVVKTRAREKYGPQLKLAIVTAGYKAQRAISEELTKLKEATAEVVCVCL